MTTYKDVSFVIQGACAIHEGENITQKCIDTIRQSYPGAEIIFSTWQHYARAVNGADVLINIDPGAINTRNSYLKNFNRMLVSTCNGVNAATRKYVAKVRSDFWFEKEYPILDHFLALPKPHRSYRDQMSSRLLMCMYRAHYPLFPYYMSDWFNFGAKRDMLRLWSGSLIEVSSIQLTRNTVSIYRRPFVQCDAYKTMDYPFHSEQQLAFNLLRNLGRAVPVTAEFSFGDLIRSYDELGKILGVVSRDALGLRSKKHHVSKSLVDTLVWSLAMRQSIYGLYRPLLMSYLAVLYARVLASQVKNQLLIGNDI